MSCFRLHGGSGTGGSARHLAGKGQKGGKRLRRARRPDSQWITMNLHDGHIVMDHIVFSTNQTQTVLEVHQYSFKISTNQTQRLFGGCTCLCLSLCLTGANYTGCPSCIGRDLPAVAGACAYAHPAWSPGACPGRRAGPAADCK